MSWLDIIQRAFAGVLLRIEARRKERAWLRAQTNIDLASQAERERIYRLRVEEAQRAEDRFFR